METISGKMLELAYPALCPWIFGHDFRRENLLLLLEMTQTSLFQLASVPSVRDVSRPQFEILEDADAQQRPPETPKQIVMSDRKALSTKKIDKRAEHADPLEVITKVSFVYI